MTTLKLIGLDNIPLLEKINDHYSVYVAPDNGACIFTYNDIFVIGAATSTWKACGDELVFTEKSCARYCKKNLVTRTIHDFHDRFGVLEDITPGQIKFSKCCFLVNSCWAQDHELPAPPEPIKEPEPPIEHSDSDGEILADGS